MSPTKLVENRRFFAFLGLVLVAVLATPRPLAGQVRAIAEMNTEQIRTMDPARTVVILPGGVLEQHGPYLPSYADGYWNERMAREVAEAISARPGWTAVLFPPIPLGVGGANEIGGKYSFPGTYSIRSTTMRAVFMDLACELGEQGFRWIFVMHSHGGVNHNQMLDEAGDFFRETYGGQMVHLLGLEPVFSVDFGLDAAAVKADGLSVHAGAAETSGIQFLRPDLVPDAVSSAPDRSGETMADLIRLARAPDWPGYLGAPRLATAAQGARATQAGAAAAISHALKILDGLDPRTIRRISDIFRNQPESAALAENGRREEQRRQATQDAWLARRRSPQR
jgi:creatinine amidohydrolase/Fe(II)-dependent formamide hydrolase-like protein